MTNKEFYDSVYSKADTPTKLLLKAWLYEMKYTPEVMDFSTYTVFFQLTSVVELINGYCIDLSDIGTKDEAIRVLLNYLKRGEIE